MRGVNDLLNIFTIKQDISHLLRKNQGFYDTIKIKNIHLLAMPGTNLEIGYADVYSLNTLVFIRT